MGVPNNAEFQTSVLKHALKLFEAPAGPVLEDFPLDAPDTTSEPYQVACPVNLRQKEQETTSTQRMLNDFASEVRQLNNWYNLAWEKKKRTTTGITGLSPEEAVDLLSAFIKKEPAQVTVKDLSRTDAIRLVAEDIKAYYFESVSAQPGQPTDSTSLANWFWGETVAALVINTIREICLEDGGKELAMLGKLLLVPRNQLHRFSPPG